MSKGVYLAHSYPWLSARLLAGAGPDGGVARMTDSRADADVIIYPKAPRRFPEARDRLTDLRPRELRRTYVFEQMADPFPWAPGMYTSLPLGRASKAFVGGFYVPHHHYEEGGLAPDLDAARSIEPDLLWSFMGTISNHPTRRLLAGLADGEGLVRDTQAWSDRVRWGWKSEHRQEGREAFSAYASLLGRSKFAVCPRGRGPASIRLFEAMEVGRAPVIVSDDWLPPPFVDWEACSIQVAEADLPRLPSLLRERQEEALPLGRRARRAWERYFSPERQLGTLVEACMLLAEAAPNRLAVLIRATLRPENARFGFRWAKGLSR